MKNWIVIDNCGFNVDSINKLTEAEFIAQYTDQRQHGVSPDDWLQWMKDAYKAIIAIGKGERVIEVPLVVKKEKEFSKKRI